MSAPGPGFAPVARLADLPPGALLSVTTPDGRAVCLANVEGEIHAVHDVCTHQAFPMSAGELTRDGCLECAWHGARFDARTGEVRRGPACEGLAVYAVTVLDGQIYVGAALPAPGEAPSGSDRAPSV